MRLTTQHFKGQVFWIGCRGARLATCEQLLQFATQHCPQPGKVVVHLGGNDIGINTTAYMIKTLRSLPDLVRHYTVGAQLLFSEIITRQNFRNIEVKIGEKVRCRVNAFARSQLSVVKHEGLNQGMDGLFSEDGVHFTSVGNVLFLQDLLKAL